MTVQWRINEKYEGKMNVVIMEESAPQTCVTECTHSSVWRSEDNHISTVTTGNLNNNDALWMAIRSYHQMLRHSAHICKMLTYLFNERSVHYNGKFRGI